MQCDLKINTSKTKAMAFGNDRHTQHTFYIYRTPIELVESFKYHGITLLRYGNWLRTQNRIAQHALFAYVTYLKI